MRTISPKFVLSRWWVALIFGAVCVAGVGPPRYSAALWIAAAALFVIALVITAWRQSDSELRCETLPIGIGQTFRGTIDTGLSNLPGDGFWLILRSVDISFHDARRSEVVLWQDELLVDPGAVISDSAGISVPFAFAMPTRGQASTKDLQWDLTITAPDYEARFVFPVVETMLPANVPDERSRPFASVRESLRK